MATHIATQADAIPVVGDNGLRGTAQRPAGPTATALEVALDDGRRVLVPLNLLQPRPDGSYYLPLGPDDITATATAATNRATSVDGNASPAGAQVIPLLAERIDVHKRRVETGTVRVSKTVQSREERVDVPLQRDEVTVERVPVGRFVAEPPPVRHEGDVMIVSLLEEVLVVEKRLRVREELRLTMRRTETHDPQAVTLRTETAQVERIPPE